MSRGQNRGRAGLKLDRALLLQLSRPAPLRLLTHALLEWAWILGAIAVATTVGSLEVNLLVIIFIATRQHALLMLMHEFAHRQLSRTRPLLNDTLGDVLTALPFLITVQGFRRNHLQHHRAPSTAADPNWVSAIKRARYRFPKSRPAMVWQLMLHCIGAYAVQDMKGYLFDAKLAAGTALDALLRQVVFSALILSAAWAWDLWVSILLYWFVPLLTVLMALLYLRDVGEHFGMPSRGLEAARTLVTGPVEGFLIAPHSVGYHAEHHLYPSVPFFRLRQLHEILRGMPGYAQHAVVTRGYLSGLLRELAHPSNEHSGLSGAEIPDDALLFGAVKKCVP